MNQSLLNWINAVSGVATAGTLIYLIVKDIITRKQLQDLTGVVGGLAEANTLQQEQNKLQQEQNQILLSQHNLQQLKMKSDARPNFKLVECKFEADDTLSLELRNLGATGIIDRFIYSDSSDVDLYNYQKEIFSGNFLIIKAKSKTENTITDCEYAFHIIYSDIYNNEYALFVLGKGKDIRQIQNFDLSTPVNRKISTDSDQSQNK